MRHGHELNCMPNRGVNDGNMKKKCMTNVPMFHYNFGLPEQIRLLPLLPCPTVSNANPGRGRKAPSRRTTEIRRLPTTLVLHIAVHSGNVDEGVMLAEAENESPTKYLSKLWRYHNANVCKYVHFNDAFSSTTTVTIDLRVP